MGQVIYQSHATSRLLCSTLLEADKRRIKEEYVYLDIINVTATDAKKSRLFKE